jgi:formate hydrogenlyase subunit 4
MSAASLVSAAVELVGGLLLAPLLPGLVQHWKARLQGRRGPSPLQPYRELRRLWGKSTVDPAGSGLVYRWAPAVAASSVAAAVLLVPVSGNAPGLGVGRDMFVLAGLLALALVAGATSLTAMVAGTAGTAAWSNPALALGAVSFALVVVAETGRQPIDNPDTHLELTMIHEGPLLEYAGRDLAYLQWAAAVRHWLVLVLAAQIFLPHAHSTWIQLGLLPVALVVLCAGLALTETLTAKMRILLVPRLLALGGIAALLGVASWLVQLT